MIDVGPETFVRCMNNNFYSSLIPAQSILKAWVEDDKSKKNVPSAPHDRRIVFVNSSASLVPIPGYTAYNSKFTVHKEHSD
jgi:3-dehydrosphinganine reductase